MERVLPIPLPHSGVEALWIMICGVSVSGSLSLSLSGESIDGQFDDMPYKIISDTFYLDFFILRILNNFQILFIFGTPGCQTSDVSTTF